MQLLSAASISSLDHACADELLDAVPLVMRIIRKHFRRHRSGLSVTQFRTLWFVSTDTRHSLSAVAEFIGLSLPAMSRLVEGLVEKHLIHRQSCEKDRRHVRLSLTHEGQTALREARQIAQEHIAAALAELSTSQKSTVRRSMEILSGIFTPEAATVDPGGNDKAQTDKD